MCIRDRPKHAELSEQYDFYADSQSALSSGMAITPEQADEVFIVLVSCGMEAKVTNVTRKAGDDGHCQVSAGLYVYDVYYTDGVVDRVEYNGEEPVSYTHLSDKSGVNLRVCRAGSEDALEERDFYIDFFHD